ncbi:hypothetical protein ACFLZH_01595 [Patescibacteria group bacterium]
MDKKCTQCEAAYTINDDELKLYEKFQIPPEELCFKCSHMGRLAFRNERVLYNRKCDLSGDDIVSIYAPDAPYKVYRAKHWYGDEWDAMDFGRDFDFNRPFFEQFKELQAEVPRLALINMKAENSDYCNMTVGNKNCYLVFGGDNNQDVQYGTLCMHNKDSLDIDISNRNEVCYFIGDSHDCYGCQYTFDSKNCSNCYFISDCIGCDECILCTNLVKKKYCIGNKQLSKEDYFKQKQEMLTGNRTRMAEMFKMLKEMRKSRIVKNFHGVNIENCTGDYINNSKNCINSFNVDNSEDLRNVIFGVETKDLLNCTYIGHKSEVCYSMIGTFTCTASKFSYFVFDSSNVEYSEQILSSNDVFGCNGLNHKKFCILNKQYKEDGYYEMRDLLIEHMKKTGEWGKFFPPDLSCFAYNENTAHQYFPLTKEQALAYGYKWREPDPKEYQKSDYKVPESIGEVDDSIVDKVLACEDCSRNYKINKTELTFYKRQNIPAPNECSECRHRVRLDMRNPVQLWDRNCDECSVEVKTTYSPERPEKVYCENCYLQNLK